MSSVIENVNASHNKDAMLNRALGTLVQLYEEKPHFIYELLQNADDCGATKAVFWERANRLYFLHNGKPFTERNLVGLTDIALSDKLPETNSIGRFGVGFKSVFTICRDVYVASDPTHWKGKGVFPKFSAKIVDFVKLEEAPEVDIPEDFTTQFSFPYATDQRYNGFGDKDELRETIASKLRDLGATTLLFLQHIKSVGYKIDWREPYVTDEFRLEIKPIKNANFSLVEAVSTMKDGWSKEGDVARDQYLRFDDKIVVDGVKLTLGLVFKVTSDKDEKSGRSVLKFVKPNNTCVSVYFPTQTPSGLNFIVHGPFSTTPNRANVLVDDPRNGRHVKALCALLKKAVLELRDAKLVTPDLINLLPFDKRDFKQSQMFLPFQKTVQELLLNEQVIPCENGGYISGEQAKLARNNEMVRLIDSNELTSLIGDGMCYGWVSTKVKEFCEYDGLFKFLSKELEVAVIVPESLKEYFNKNNRFLKSKSGAWLKRFYDLYATLPNIFDERRAATNMMGAAIIKTKSGDFVPAMRDDGNGKYIFNVFRPISTTAKSAPETVVDPSVYKGSQPFFDDVLKLPSPNGCELFISEFVDRYASDKPVNDAQHVADIKSLLRYLDSPGTQQEVRGLIFKHLKLRGKCAQNNVFRNPIASDYKLSDSATGDSLADFYADLAYPVCFVDEVFYSANGINRDDLLKLGVRQSIVFGENTTDGEDAKMGAWKTLGSFRYELMIDRLPEILIAMQDAPQSAASRIKSKMIFDALVEYQDALKGKIQIGGMRLSDELTSKALAFMLNEERVQMSFLKVWQGAWLYAKDGRFVAPCEVSKGDLDEKLYGSPLRSDAFYELFGFKQDEEAEVRETVKRMPQAVKDRVFSEELKRRYSDPKSRKSILAMLRSSGATFDEDFSLEGGDDDFPIHSVRDFERLRIHVMEMLAFANPVEFAKRMRSVKVSAIGERAKAYLRGLYLLSSGKMMCQSCHKSQKRVEAVGMFLARSQQKELEPAHLCLCHDCAADYKAVRGDEKAMVRFCKKILTTSDEVMLGSDPIEFKVGQNLIWFTPLHFAEVKLLMELQK